MLPSSVTPRAIFYLVAVAAMSACVAYLLAVGFIVVPAADDYCSLVATRDAGFVDFIREFYMEFNGRFASGVVTGTVYNFGIEGFMVVSKLALTALFLLLSYALAPLSRVLFDDFPGRSFVIPAGLVIGLFLVGRLPGRVPYEYLHWLPGLISYTLPIALLALMWRFASSSAFAFRRPAWTAVIVFVASAFLATFHEFVAAFAAAIACIIFIVDCLLARPLVQAFLKALAVVAGSAVGLLSIYFSPGVNARRAALTAILKRDIPLNEALREGAKDVVVLAQSFQSWPGVLTLAVGTTVGMVVYAALRARWQQLLRTRSLAELGNAVGVGALAFLAVLWGVASVSRLYYGAIVPDRMLVYPYVFLLVELGLVGVVVAALLNALLGRRPALGYAVLTLLVSVASVGVWRATTMYWQRVDQRRLTYERIIAGLDEARRTGVLRVSGTSPILGVGETSPVTDYWVNRCQADYFGVATVVAE